MNLQNYNKWDSRFLDLAKFISTWSKDPSTQVGAIITDWNNRVISIGYNGFPQNIKDDNRLSVRKDKYQIIVHAEVNAILFANIPLKNCTIYTYPFMPCPTCAGMIIQAGINRVVSYNNMPARWKDNFKISANLFKEAKIELQLYE